VNSNIKTQMIMVRDSLRIDLINFEDSIGFGPRGIEHNNNRALRIYLMDRKPFLSVIKRQKNGSTAANPTNKAHIYRRKEHEVYEKYEMRNHILICK